MARGAFSVLSRCQRWGEGSFVEYAKRAALGAWPRRPRSWFRQHSRRDPEPVVEAAIKPSAENRSALSHQHHLSLIASKSLSRRQADGINLAPRTAFAIVPTARFLHGLPQDELPSPHCSPCAITRSYGHRRGARKVHAGGAPEAITRVPDGWRIGWRRKRWRGRPASALSLPSSRAALRRRMVRVPDVVQAEAAAFAVCARVLDAAARPSASCQR